MLNYPYAFHPHRPGSTSYYGHSDNSFLNEYSTGSFGNSGPISCLDLHG